MRTAKLVAPYRIEVGEAQEPQVNDSHQVLVRVKAVGICGTDLHTFKGERTDVEFPRVMGHELSGIVIGAGDSVSRVKEGDHVIYDPVNSCGNCRTCSSGHENVCREVKCFGVQMDGGFQDVIAVSEDKLYPVPKEIPFEYAALPEPFSIAANIIAKADMRQEDRVVIFGAGTIGIAVLQAVKRLGNQVLVTDMAVEKLALARGFGADETVNSLKDNLHEAVGAFSPGGADILIDAVGTASILSECIQLAAPCANIVEIGFDEQESLIRPSDITKKELTIKGSRMNCHRFDIVAEWLKEGLITDKMISRIYPLEQIEQAFRDTLEQGGTWLKTMIRL